ncbi:terminase family protein [Rhizobium sp. CSW-27]|uniref:DNA-packaging protein n=1 Tax=Rhizobium sp. CSW-27 TaxID=2839985 RepID=UPI0020784F6E|nr:terminase family protein [Rhizobium sp. CSW-27]
MSAKTLLEEFSDGMKHVGEGRKAASAAPGAGGLPKDVAQGVATVATVPCEPVMDLQRHGIDLPERVVREAARLSRSWTLAGRAEQKPPAGDWRTWLVMGGRGSGKTRAGAEWVHGLATALPRCDLRIALVAETLGDAREVMIDGVSGICRIAGRLAPDFEISRRRLVWPTGAVAQIFSSEDPESLRGPQFHFAWCDELAKWKHADDTFDMLQFGLRLGAAPRQLVTTTPRPVPVLKRLIADPATRLVKIATRDNAEHLAPGFLAALEERYRGTRLGRQELEGELIEDRSDGLWKRADLEALVIRFTGALRRIVVAVDPPSGQGEKSCCGIVVAGLETGGRAVVLADCSVEGLSPAGWAQAVVKTFRRFAADRVVAEVNQGGEMVAAMLRSVDETLPLTQVRATRGKFLRAEPVAALYEQGRVAHAGRFAELEDQMCDFGPDGLSGGRSPDRLDALVWALTALLLEGQAEPRVRGL